MRGAVIPDHLPGSRENMHPGDEITNLPRIDLIMLFKDAINLNYARIY
jgi:hypothetical protein